MSKSPDAFRSIGEVSRLVGVAPHVLRYWESQFPQLAPVKRADGRRYYRPDDVRLAAGLCQVMREEGLSIRGARRLIANDRGLGLREIGAARLGETLGQAADRPAPAAVAPADAEMPAGTRAETPQAAPVPNTAASTATQTPAAPAQQPPAPRAPRAKPPRQPDSMPLFDGIAAPAAPTPKGWLDRLAVTAARLRGQELAARPLPPQARDLRLSLRDPR